MFAVVKDFFVKKSTSILSNIPNLVNYSFNPKNYPNMKMPIPIGVSEKGLIVRDFAGLHNMFVVGLPSYGKTNFLRQVIHGLANNPVLKEIVILDFRYLEYVEYSKYETVNILSTIEEVRSFLAELNDEMGRRFKLLRQKELTDFKQLPEGSLPYYYIVIDDIELIQDKLCANLLSHIISLSKAIGFNFIVGKQRPLMDSVLMNNFGTTIAFRLKDTSKRVVFGSDSNLEYPDTIGRAYYLSDESINPIEVQTMHFKRTK